MSQLLEQLEEAINETEQWALACNLPYQYADDGAVAPASGVHWRWVTGEDWVTTVPDPVLMEVVEGEGGDCRAHLATVEEWPSGVRYGSPRMMPRTYDGGVEEMDSAAAGHIIRNDPARILRRVARDRKLIELAKILHEDGQDNAADHLIRLLAEDYGIEVES